MAHKLIVAMLVAGIAGATSADTREGDAAPASLVIDWASRHVIFTDPRSESGRAAVDAVLASPAEMRRHIRSDTGVAALNANPEEATLANPRFWQQQLRRYASAAVAEARAKNEMERDKGKEKEERKPRHDKDEPVERDWSFPLNGGSGGATGSPAKFVFSVTAAPSCTNDFVVTGVNVAGAAGQANLVGLSNLYSNPGGTGLCAGTGPAVMFAYNIGPGSVPSNVSLSLDGKKIAFIENNGASTFFHILTWKTGAGNGTSASAAATPGTGNTAVDVKFPLGTAATTAPYVDYQRDVAYVTDNSGIAHKFTGVFTGTPAEVSGGGTGWPLNTGVVISTPVYDSVTRRVFVTTVNGIRYIDDSVTPAVLSPNTFNFSPGGGNQQTPVIVDSTNQKVYAFGRNDGGANALIAQADTSLSAASQVTTAVGAGTANPNPRQGDFNDAYYSGNAAGAFLYVTGNRGTNQRPVLYRIGFNAAFRMNNTTANGPLSLSSNVAGIIVSPITIFFNSTQNKEYLFVAVSGSCSPLIPGGCIRSLDITGGFPATVGLVVLPTAGGTGGITVDNNSSASEAASVYFTPVTGNTLVKATQAALQ